MGLVDFGRRWHGRLTDRLAKQRVVFHHVPKCGGTSVGRALRLRYLISQDTVLPEESFKALALAKPELDHAALWQDVRNLREQMFHYLLYRDVRCVSAHVRFSNQAFESFSDQYKFVTILRDPVERYLSHYYYSHNAYKKGGAEASHGVISTSLEEFVASPRGRENGAMYAEYFSGLGADADYTSDEAVERAKANLDRMDLVGFLDHVDDFAQGLSSLLNVRLRVGHENKAAARASRSELPPELLNKITEICTPDQAIYDHVRNKAGL